MARHAAILVLLATRSSTFIAHLLMDTVSNRALTIGDCGAISLVEMGWHHNSPSLHFALSLHSPLFFGVKQNTVFEK